MRDPIGAACMKREWVKLRIPEIEARLRQMREPVFAWNGERLRERDALEEELGELIRELGNLERLPELS